MADKQTRTPYPASLWIEALAHDWPQLHASYGLLRILIPKTVPARAPSLLTPPQFNDCLAAEQRALAGRVTTARQYLVWQNLIGYYHWQRHILLLIS